MYDLVCFTWSLCLCLSFWCSRILTTCLLCIALILFIIHFFFGDLDLYVDYDFSNTLLLYIYIYFIPPQKKSTLQIISLFLSLCLCDVDQ
ncbi:hypothetical protein F4703DRAFT_1539473 [Phycomyces blakesleeanus]